MSEEPPKDDHYSLEEQIDELEMQIRANRNQGGNINERYADEYEEILYHLNTLKAENTRLAEEVEGLKSELTIQWNNQQGRIEALKANENSFKKALVRDSDRITTLTTKLNTAREALKEARTASICEDDDEMRDHVSCRNHIKLLADKALKQIGEVND